VLDEATFLIVRDIGRDLFLRGLISSHAGNMSVRADRTIHITRRGSMLGRLRREDMVDVDMKESDECVPAASSELAAHRAVYSSTQAHAVIHAHPPYATLLSMMREEIVPIDFEGSYLFKAVPVIVAEKNMGSEEAAAAVSNALQDHDVVVVRGHGSFARGDTPEEAFMFTTSLEASSFYVYHMHEAREGRAVPGTNKNRGRRPL